MKYRILKGKISYNSEKYGVGDIIDIEPEVADRFPSNSVIQVKEERVVEPIPDPLPVIKPSPAQKTSKKD